MQAQDELLALFADYNPAVWPIQLVAWVAALAGIGLLAWRPSPATDRLLVGFLAAIWLVIGIVFQGVYVRDIDPTLSTVYAAAFVIQVVLLVGYGVAGNRVRLRLERTPTVAVGLLLIVYALLVYPLIGVALGHPYPEAPLFGAAPCPTTIFTFGLLLLAGRPVPKALLVVPMLWAVVATPAAVGRGVYEDVALLVAGIVASAIIAWRDHRAADGTRTMTGRATRVRMAER
jgi:hypothetical protein